MKTIIVVPHTHWDREWYFTNQTSDILLNRMKKDIINQKVKFPFNLDGQASLIDDMFEDKTEIPEFVKKNNITTGPLYIQQDTFNTMISTTLYNIEIARDLLYNNVPKTMYMPDSFGFNEQLPQIFKKYGFDNFVHWRGIKPEHKKHANFFQWQGIDGTKINVSTMAEGYYCMGQYYPYNEERDYKNFLSKMLEQVKLQESRREQSVYWVPLGGDEAPYERNLPNAIKYLNKNQKEYTFVIGTHDDYFKSVKPDNKVITGRLDYSGTSKIHRTIHSSRYDIKKVFRDAEIAVYYQMEPLEIIYKNMGGTLLSKDEKDKHIYKELLKSSAHDSLGGCNLDLTNELVLARNKNVLSFTKSYIDSMMRDIKEFYKVKDDEYLVINLAPFKRDVSFTDTISTDNHKLITSKNNEIVEYDQDDISWEIHEDIINHKVSINVKDMKPLSIKKIKLQFVDKISTVARIAHPKFKIKIEADEGDTYDFAFGSKSKEKIINKFDKKWTIGNKEHNITKYYIKEIHAYLYEFTNSVGKTYDMIVHNKLKNVRVSMVIDKTSNTVLSRHLALVNQELDDIKDWKEKGYKDMPINSFPNDGLVSNGKQNIMTSGTNEVYIENKVNIILYRGVDFLGKPELNTRPGSASGLTMKCPTPESQLNKELLLNFRINSGDMISDLNNWYFKPIGIYGKNVNPIINRVERFVWNNLEMNKPSISVQGTKNKLIGRLRSNEDNIELVYSKPDQNKWKIYYEKIK